MFKDRAHEAMEFYCSVFKKSKIVSTMKQGGKVMGGTFTLNGTTFMCYEGGPHFAFTEGVSLMVSCKTQKEVDYYWNKLTSGGGMHESLDQGKTWNTLIDGMEVVEGFGFDIMNPMFHDPHCVRMCPSNPDRLYQQNHCGIYRIDRPGNKWTRIGRAMPKSVGDVGFPMVVHPRDDKTCWVFPMDGSGVWPRVSPGGKPAAFVTRNGGKTWQRQDNGMPRQQAWWTVKRQAMTADARDPVGLYFGNTQGELWQSRDEGKKWECMARNLPEIYSVEAVEM